MKAAAAVDREGEQVVDQEIQCAEIWLQNELSWMQISDDGYDGSCAH